VQYEIGGSSSAGLGGWSRWAAATSLSAIVFVAAGAVGADDPRKLVAASTLAVFFTATAAWLANRRPASIAAFSAGGPSMQELAQSLRSLPPYLGQALPRTSRMPLGAAIYDRLFALGHDPGRRPHR
jgi:amino acid transporter